MSATEHLLKEYEVGDSDYLKDYSLSEKRELSSSWSHPTSRGAVVDVEMAQEGKTAKYASAPAFLAGNVFSPRFPKSGVWGAFVNVTKAIVGAGSFTMPRAFQDMGIYGGMITIILISFVSAYTILNLVKCKRHVLKASLQRDITYVDTARFAFGMPGAFVVYLFSCMASVGVCSAFFSFIGEMLADITVDILKAIGVHPEGTTYDLLTSHRFMMLASLVIVVPLVFLRSLSYLSFTSVLGMICLFSGMFATMYYGATEHGIEKWENYEKFRGIDTYFDSFGSVAFLFCVNFLILPIEKSMRKPKKFWISLNSSVVVVCISNAAFGLFGYLFYAGATEGNVIKNVTNSVWTMVVKGSLAFDLVFTIPIVMAPTIEIVEKTFICPRASWFETKRNIVRLVLLALALSAAQLSSFNQITNMVGGVAMVSLGFIMPQAMCFKLFYKSTSILTKCLYIGLILFGIFSSIFTCYTTIVQIIKG